MKAKYTIHLLGLVHLPTSEKYLACAFTQKNRKLAKMLTDAGHDVVFYGAEGSDVQEYAGHGKGTITFIQTHTLADIRRDYGDGDNRFEIGYDWKSNEFRHDFNDEKKKLSTVKYYASVINHINQTKKPDDILYLTQGYYQKPISDAVQLFLTVEGGIGYRGSFAP